MSKYHSPDVDTKTMQKGLEGQVPDCFRASCTCGDTKHWWLAAPEGWQMEDSQ